VPKTPTVLKSNITNTIKAKINATRTADDYSEHSQEYENSIRLLEGVRTQMHTLVDKFKNSIHYPELVILINASLDEIRQSNTSKIELQLKAFDTTHEMKQEFVVKGEESLTDPSDAMKETAKIIINDYRDAYITTNNIFEHNPEFQRIHNTLSDLIKK